MIQQTAAPTQYLTCDSIGTRNTFGKPKLLATIDEHGISVWCKYCRAAHLIPRERVLAAWERGESVQCEVAQGEARV